MPDTKEESARNEAAGDAAEALLRGGGGAGSGRSNPTVRRYGAIPQFFRSRSNLMKNRACCGLMSAVRRTFCLLVTFDFILTFLLWGVYVKLKDFNGTTFNQSLEKNLYEEVVKYSFQTSLFDMMMMALARFLFLVLAYGLCRLSNPSVIAITTFCTSLFTIVKVFIYSFSNTQYNPVSYVLLIESFVIVWAETYFLDFQVLPQELSNLPSTIEVLENRDTQSGGREQPESDFCTPEEGSDLEDDAAVIGGHRGLYSPVNAEYRQRADAAWRQALYVLHLQEGWKRESSVGDIIVHSQYFSDIGKLFRLEANINASAQEVFDISTVRFSEIPSWNQTVSESKILQQLTPNIDITYSVTAVAGKGLVSSRDFVTVRQWKMTDTGCILSAGCAVTHPSMPPQNEHYRGENRLTGWMFQQMPNNPNQCLLQMVISTDIKGWIPVAIVDQALTGVLVESIQNLQKHVKETRLVDL